MVDISSLKNSILESIEKTETSEALEAIRVESLGKKGSISNLLKSLGTMESGEREEKGPIFNHLKTEIFEKISEKRQILKNKEIEKKLANEWLDVTLPVNKSPALEGRIHPITQVIEEISAIFADMGFSIAEGPDIETDYYNFTALNFPENHPAREMHDTFFFKENENGERKLLRTHTSPVQIRTMEKQEPPIRIIIPGKTYRMDFDATHSPMFHQLEGLVIEKNVTIAHLKGVLQNFCQSFFEVDNINMRFRPSFFPFTEPSMEVDIQCSYQNNSIKIGTGNDWLEILGCGMVHPNVLRAGGIDPDEYQGFAWGLGIDRITMLKYGIPDLRSFFDGDKRWINHYGFASLDIPSLWNGLSKD